ncbi:hydrogenase maturation protease [Telmatobacter bradus]|uniref:hydrogenase maturation protease n=1 Tax=Telmatobacter bradus TaxID=474953 RepID=UPI003B4342FD
MTLARTPESSIATHCLVLACGNTLRSDDGVGPWLAAWLEAHFANRQNLRILCRQQWTPEVAEDLARSRTALFLDCSISAAPGELRLQTVEPAAGQVVPGTHHMGAAELLALSLDLYNSQPQRSLLLTIGAGSLELGEAFSPEMTTALPAAQRWLVEAVETLLK